MSKRLVLTVCLGLLIGLTSFAATTHKINGKIVDEKGKGLPGANIVVAGIGKGASTNLAGEYNISDLPSGTFEFTVSMIGYETTSQDVTVVADQEITFSLLPKAYQSQPVIVTASRTRQKLQDSPVTTSVIEAEQIAERNFLSADEAMRFIGGVSMNKSQISIRNSSGFVHGAGTRVLVMIDGVPMSAGDTGEIKWDSMPIGQIEQLEVVKSAGSALYGSDAMGGVINIITRKPEEKSTYRITTEIGAWDKPAYEEWEWTQDTRLFHRLGIEHTRQIKDWGFLFSIEEKQDESFRQADYFYRGSFFGKATKRIGNSNNLSFMTNIAYEDRGCGLEWFSQKNALMVDPGKEDDRVWSSKINGNVIYSGNSNGGKQVWIVKGYTNYNNWVDYLYDGNGGYDHHRSESNKAGADVQYTFVPSDDHRFTTGGDFNLIIIDATIFGKHSGFGGALYLQDEINTFNPLVATIGLRGDVFRVNVADDYDGEVYAQLNPKIGVVYHISENFAARSNFGTGFRMPTMAELFTEMNAGGILKVRPNPTLKAEQAYSAEGGINWISHSQMIDVAIFNTWYKDMIEPIPFLGNQVKFMNIQDANIFGVETSMKCNIGEVFGLGNEHNTP
ncbi:TonB-dependent receptor, partial [bacterium]|nr:TonB-dependent receptor [bacterium]